MTPWWRKVFQRGDAISKAVEHAVVEQAAFEAAHPVRFDQDQRLRALRQRFAVAYGGNPPPAAEALLLSASANLAAAVRPDGAAP